MSRGMKGFFFINHPVFIHKLIFCIYYQCFKINFCVICKAIGFLLYDDVAKCQIKKYRITNNKIYHVGFI